MLPVSFRYVFGGFFLVCLLVEVALAGEPTDEELKEDHLEVARLAQSFERYEAMEKLLKDGLKQREKQLEITKEDLQLLHSCFKGRVDIARESWSRLKTVLDRKGKLYPEITREYMRHDENEIGQLCDKALEKIDEYYPLTKTITAGVFGYIYRGDFHRYKIPYKTNEIDKEYYIVVADEIYKYALGKLEDPLSRTEWYDDFTIEIVHKLVAFRHEIGDCMRASQLLLKYILKAQNWKAANPMRWNDYWHGCIVNALEEHLNYAKYNSAANDDRSSSYGSDTEV